MSFMPISVNATPENKAAAVKFDFLLQGQSDQNGKVLRSGKDGDGMTFVPVEPNDVKGLEGTAGGSRMDLALTMAFQRKASTIFLLSDGRPAPNGMARLSISMTS